MNRQLLSGVCLALFLGAGSIPARAQGPARRVGSKKKGPRVTVYLDIKPDHRKGLGRVVSKIERAFKKNKRLRFRAVQWILERPKFAIRRLTKADRLVAEAKADLTNLEVTKAVAKLQRAVRLVERSFKVLVRIKQKSQPLADALRGLATAYFLNGQQKEAKETIGRLLVQAPQTQYAPKLFPKQMAQMVDDERLLFDQYGTGGVEVTTVPAGAKVYLNAHRKGFGPVMIKKVRRGLNYVTARLPGYIATTAVVEVDPPKVAKLEIKLKKYRKTDPLPLMKAAAAELGRKKAGPGITGLGRRLKVDILVLGRAEVDVDQARVTLYAYDLRLKQLLKGPVKSSMSLDFPSGKSKALARLLFAGVPLDGKPPKKPKKKKPRRSAWVGFGAGWRNFRRWKGFWPTVGSVTGAIVIGVVVGLVVGLQPPKEQGLIRGGARHVVLGHSLARF